LWAREKIKLLDDYNQLRQTDERIKEVTQLGLDYNLMTAYTSFIAIDNEVVKGLGAKKAFRMDVKAGKLTAAQRALLEKTIKEEMDKLSLVQKISLAAQLKGKVQLEITIDKKGQVKAAYLVKNGTKTLVAKKPLELLKKWNFVELGLTETLVFDLLIQERYSTWVKEQ